MKIEITQSEQQKIDWRKKNEQSFRAFGTVTKDLAFMSSESQEKKKWMGLKREVL